MKALLAAVLFSNPVANVSEDSDWILVNSHELFSIEVPSYMEVSEDLNSEATHQYQYYDGTHELYLITLVETKEEIASYDLGYEFNAMSYWQLAFENLESGLDAFKVTTKDPVIEKHNSCKLVRGYAKGKLGKIKVTYHLGVYEGEHAFYQILTWTVTEQCEYFKSDMERIIMSFVEK